MACCWACRSVETAAADLGSTIAVQWRAACAGIAGTATITESCAPVTLSRSLFVTHPTSISCVRVVSVMCTRPVHASISSRIPSPGAAGSVGSDTTDTPAASSLCTQPSG